MYEFDWTQIVGWIVSSTVVASLIAMFAHAADRYWKRPALAHILWVLVLIKLLLPPLVTLPIALDPSQISWLSANQLHGHASSLSDSRDNERMTGIANALGGAAEKSGASGIAGAHPADLSLFTWIATAWFAGSVVLASWIFITARRLNRLIEQVGHVDVAATRQVRRLWGPSRQGPPPVWLVDAILSPMLVGTGKNSKIIFPGALWSRLDHEARRLLLVHELEHWRRRDALVRYLESIAWVVLWWHPLVWIARRQIEDCEERCCDSAASRQANTAPRVYAEAILATLDFLSEPGGWQREIGRRPIASALGRIPQIEQRLRGIMSAEDRRHLGARGRLFIAAMVLLLPLHLAVVFDRSVQPQVELVQPQTDLGAQANAIVMPTTTSQRHGTAG